MAKKNFHLHGHVIDRNTRQGLAGVRVEAWDKDQKFDDHIASAVTDAEGAFKLTIDAARFQDAYKDQYPDLYFKIYRGNQLLRDTQDAVLWNKDTGEQDLLLDVVEGAESAEPSPGSGRGQLNEGIGEASVADTKPTGGSDAPGAGKGNDRYLVQGVVRREDNSPVYGARVRLAFVPDPDRDHYLETKTDDNGTYYIYYQPPVKKTKLRILAVDPGQHALGVSDIFEPGIEQKQDVTIKPLAKGAPPIEDQLAGRQIRGRLRHADGTPAVGMIKAANVSLSGATPLGEAKTNENGSFLIVYDWSGPKKPDLKLRAFREGEVIAESKVKYNAQKVEHIDLFIENKDYVGPSEYARLEHKIRRCFEGANPASFGEKEIEYLVSKTNADNRQVGFYVLAHRHASITGSAPQLFYALFRNELPRTLEALVLLNPSVMGQAIRRAIKRNIIGERFEDKIDNFFLALNKVALQGALKLPEQSDVATLGTLFSLIDLPADLQNGMLTLYLEHKGDTRTFWEKLGRSRKFKAYAEPIRFVLQAGALSQYHLPTVEKLLAKAGNKDGLAISRLTALSSKEWDDLTQSLTTFPANIPGQTQAEQAHHYARLMEGAVSSAFPTAHVGANIMHSEKYAGTEVQRFFEASPDFDLGVADLPKVVDQYTRDPELKTDLTETLSGMQRLYRLSPDSKQFQVIDELYQDGLTSSLQIHELGKSAFLNQYGPKLGEATAQTVYNNAVRVSATALNTAIAYQELGSEALPYVIKSNGSALASVSPSEVTIPDLSKLFGAQSYCECEHCRSVYSPAAYLVDLLAYVNKHYVVDEENSTENTTVYKQILDRETGDFRLKTGLDVLFARRSEIGDILLNCENTNTVLPYIDLVNEILENAVAGSPNAYQTEGTEEELRANPEHLNLLAYEELSGAVFPFTLPFSLWNEEGRIYLNHLGVPRWELTKTLRFKATSDPETHAEYLHLTTADTAIITGKKRIAGQSYRLHDFWGLPATKWTDQLSNVPLFLHQSSLDYEELLQLLQVGYVNPDGDIAIDFSASATECDLEGARLAYKQADGTFLPDPISKDAFDAIHRFLRLRLKLGWTILELGKTMKSLEAADIDSHLVVQVSILKRLSEHLDVPLLEALSWWSPLNTDADENDLADRSFYEQVFLNKTVMNPVEQTFELNEDGTRLEVEDQGGTELISQHLPAIAAALNISQADLSLLAATLVDASGAVDDQLTLVNLSQLYRMVSFSKSLDLSVSDYLSLGKLIELDPFDKSQPNDTLLFVNKVEAITNSPFSIPELDYLLRHNSTAAESIAPTEDSIAVVFQELQTGLRKIAGENAPVADPTGDITRDKLAAVFDEETVAEAVAIIESTSDLTSEQEDFVTLHFDFLDTADMLAQFSGPGKLEDITERYEYVLTPLLAHLTATQSTALVIQALSDALGIDLSVAELLLTENIEYPAGTGKHAIEYFLDEAFAYYGQEKLAAILEGNVLDEAFAIIEGTSGLSTADQEAFVDDHFDFLDPAEAKEKLLGAQQLETTLERYEYVVASLEAGQVNINSELFPDQFAVYFLLHKVASIVLKFTMTHLELPWIAQYATDLDWIDFNQLPLAETDSGTLLFASWEKMVRLFELRDALPEGDLGLFDLLDMSNNPARIAVDDVDQEILDFVAASPDWDQSNLAFLVWLNDLSQWTGWNVESLYFLAGPQGYALALRDFKDEEVLYRLKGYFRLVDLIGMSAEEIWRWRVPDLTDEISRSIKQAAKAKYDLDEWLMVAQPLRDELREKQRQALVAYMIHRGDFEDSTRMYEHYLVDPEMDACMMTSRIKLAISSVQLFVQRCLMNLEDELVEIDDVETWEWMKNYRVWEANRKVFLYPENWIEPELRLIKSEFFQQTQNALLQNEVTADTAETALLEYLEQLDAVSNIEVCGMYYQYEAGEGATEEEIEATTIDVLHVVGRTQGLPHEYYYRRREDDAYWTPWEKIDLDIEGEHLIPVILNRRLYLFWPAFTEKQEHVFNVLDEVILYEAAESVLEEEYNALISGYISQFGVETYDEFVEYIVDPEGWSGSQEIADALLEVYGYPSHSEFVGAEAKKTYIDENYDVSIPYYEIKLAYSRYKAGDWQPKKISKVWIDSDKKDVALAQGFDNLSKVEPKDFHFYTEVLSESLKISCVQTLNFLDGQIARYGQGEFEYNYLNGKMTAEEAEPVVWGILALIGLRSIITPTEATVEHNAFLENESSTQLELTSASVDSRGDYDRQGASELVPVLDRTLGEYRIPIPHQYDEFVSQTDFFYGDDDRIYFVRPKATGWKKSVQEYTFPKGGLWNGSSHFLTDYLSKDDVPLGIFSEVVYTNVGSRRLIEETASMRTTDLRIKAVEPLPVDSASLDRVVIPQATGLGEIPLVERMEVLIGKKYRFEPFYHPYVGEFIKALNRDGVKGVINREFQQEKDETYFEETYLPTTNVTSPYPIKEVDFSEAGAYSLYNWELFFHIPLLLADRLSKNQKFAEAQQWFHFVFDPTDRSNEISPQKFWQFLPLFELYPEGEAAVSDSIYNLLYALSYSGNDPELLAKKEEVSRQVEAWLKNPFDPHAIARLRPVAYMKTTVMKYLDNLIAWGDYLFNQFTIEAINEATQLYVLAYQILGERPQRIAATDVEARSYNELPALDEFSNALIAIENHIDPNVISTNGSINQVEQVPMSLYFCVPNNPHLLSYWDIVEDRLFKIRHCMTIEGVVRQLPLFQPPIDPGLLVRARAAGVDIGAALSDINTPLPHYRFQVILQKAVEFGNEVRNLGGALLAALEKQDAEQVSLLRAEKETQLLGSVRSAREAQLKEAKENIAALERSQAIVQERLEYYSQLKKRSDKENQNLDRLSDSERKRKKAGGAEVTASILHVIPNVSFGTGASSSFGGSNLGSASNATAGVFRNESAAFAYQANKASIEAGYDRRWEEWKLQERLAEKELKQIEKQMVAAEIRRDIAEKELENHDQQTENARVVEAYMRDKFTNQELYSWMVSQISGIYFQSYQMAYDLAKQAEKAYQHELGVTDTSFIQFGYWDSLKKGLLAGEKLNYDLRRMEMSHLEQNKREYEITKHVSLAMLDPEALVTLRETGTCFVNLPEAIFDLDFPGHYKRRVKSVSLTIPCVTGPYASVNCTLTLLGNQIRIQPQTGTDDSLFQFNVKGIQSIATSSAQNDSGLFELNFRDERYLPFEGAGVISNWRIELPSDFRQFDYDTIADVIMHVRYTALDGGTVFKQDVENELTNELNAMMLEAGRTGLYRLFSARQEFPNEWHQFLYPAADQTSQSMLLNLTQARFPFEFRAKTIKIQSLTLLAKPKNGVDSSGLTINLSLTPADPADTEPEKELTASGDLGGLLQAVWDFPSQPEIPGEWTLAVVGDSLDPEDVEDIGILCHYYIES